MPIAFSALLFGCMKETDNAVSTLPVKATIYDTEGKNLGDVVFTPSTGGTMVDAKLSGLGANEEHGLHVHENGECVGDLKSSGGHFNPSGHEHGAPGPNSHAGDLGNLKTDDVGNVDYHYESEALKVNSSSGGIIGKSVIIHADADDLKSQPSGNSGKRIACGIIRS